MFKNHTSFFLYLKDRGTTIRLYLSTLVNDGAGFAFRGQKTGQHCIVCYQKQIHLVQTPCLRSLVCGQMEQELSTHGCQAKSKSDGDTESNVTSAESGSIGNETSCERLETASSPTEPTSPEEKAQEIYPWMKEFRSKGTKQNSYFSRDIKWAWVKSKPRPFLELVSSDIFANLKNKSPKFSSIAWVEFCFVLVGVKFVNCGPA